MSAFADRDREAVSLLPTMCRQHSDRKAELPFLDEAYANRYGWAMDAIISRVPTGNLAIDLAAYPTIVVPR